MANKSSLCDEHRNELFEGPDEHVWRKSNLGYGMRTLGHGAQGIMYLVIVEDVQVVVKEFIDRKKFDDELETLTKAQGLLVPKLLTFDPKINQICLSYLGACNLYAVLNDEHGQCAQMRYLFNFGTFMFSVSQFASSFHDQVKMTYTDFKLENIIVQQQQNFKLVFKFVDLGSAVQLGSMGDPAGTYVTMPRSFLDAAPHQVLYHKRSDQESLVWLCFDVAYFRWRRRPRHRFDIFRDLDIFQFFMDMFRLRWFSNDPRFLDGLQGIDERSWSNKYATRNWTSSEYNIIVKFFKRWRQVEESFSEGSQLKGHIFTFFALRYVNKTFY